MPGSSVDASGDSISSRGLRSRQTAASGAVPLRSRSVQAASAANSRDRSPLFSTISSSSSSSASPSSLSHRQSSNSPKPPLSHRRATTHSPVHYSGSNSSPQPPNSPKLRRSSSQLAVPRANRLLSIVPTRDRDQPSRSPSVDKDIPASAKSDSVHPVAQRARSHTSATYSRLAESKSKSSVSSASQSPSPLRKGGLTRSTLALNSLVHIAKSSADISPQPPSPTARSEIVSSSSYSRSSSVRRSKDSRAAKRSSTDLPFSFSASLASKIDRAEPMSASASDVSHYTNSLSIPGPFYVIGEPLSASSVPAHLKTPTSAKSTDSPTTPIDKLELPPYENKETPVERIKRLLHFASDVDPGIVERLKKRALSALGRGVTPSKEVLNLLSSFPKQSRRSSCGSYSADYLKSPFSPQSADAAIDASPANTTVPHSARSSLLSASPRAKECIPTSANSQTKLPSALLTPGGNPRLVRFTEQTAIIPPQKEVAIMDLKKSALRHSRSNSLSDRRSRSGSVGSPPTNVSVLSSLAPSPPAIDLTVIVTPHATDAAAHHSNSKPAASALTPLSPPKRCVKFDSEPSVIPEPSPISEDSAITATTDGESLAESGWSAELLAGDDSSSDSSDSMPPPLPPAAIDVEQASEPSPPTPPPFEPPVLDTAEPTPATAASSSLPQHSRRHSQLVFRSSHGHGSAHSGHYLGPNRRWSLIALDQMTSGQSNFHSHPLSFRTADEMNQVYPEGYICALCHKSAMNEPAFSCPDSDCPTAVVCIACEKAALGISDSALTASRNAPSVHHSRSHSDLKTIDESTQEPNPSRPAAFPSSTSAPSLPSPPLSPPKSVASDSSFPSSPVSSSALIRSPLSAPPLDSHKSNKDLRRAVLRQQLQQRLDRVQVPRSDASSDDAPSSAGSTDGRIERVQRLLNALNKQDCYSSSPKSPSVLSTRSASHIHSFRAGAAPRAGTAQGEKRATRKSIAELLFSPSDSN